MRKHPNLLSMLHSAEMDKLVEILMQETKRPRYKEFTATRPAIPFRSMSAKKYPDLDTQHHDVTEDGHLSKEAPSESAHHEQL